MGLAMGSIEVKVWIGLAEINVAVEGEMRLEVECEFGVGVMANPIELQFWSRFL